MNEFLKAKNKLLIISFVVILLEYTQTTITNFKIMNINFELKEEYIINSFNIVFHILLFYYFFQFLLYRESLQFNDEYKNIIRQENKRYFICSNSFSPWYFKFLLYLTSFKFLNIHLSYYIFLIIPIILLLKQNSILLWLLSIICIISIELITYFQEKKAKKRIENFFNQSIDDEYTRLINLRHKIEEIKEKNNLSLEEKKIINKAIETFNKRQKNLTKLLDILK